MRYPGTIRVDILEPIAPGLDKQDFVKRLQDNVETATAHLVAEGQRELERAGVTRPV
jgi:1-acyl-sn-glycerol-3-phosphate acyltransferase